MPLCLQEAHALLKVMKQAHGETNYVHKTYVLVSNGALNALYI